MDNTFLRVFEIITVLIKNGPKMKERDLVFVDLEMTGLKIDHEIIEIGWLKVDSKTLQVKEEHNIKIAQAT